MAESNQSEASAPLLEASFRFRYQNTTSAKVLVLKYRNKDWLDVVRTAIAEAKQEDEDEGSTPVNQSTETNQRLIKPTALVTINNSSELAPDITPTDFKQNFSGVSFKDAHKLVRQTISLSHEDVIKFFNPKNKLEVRTKKEFVAAFDDWQDAALGRWELYHARLFREILNHLTCYCQTKTSSTVVAAVADERGPSATTIEDQDTQLSSAATTVSSSDTDNKTSDHGSIIRVESHDAALQTLSKLEYCMYVVQNAKSSSFLTQSDWKKFLRRCWHHLLRMCRSSNYFVATQAANLLVSQDEFVLLGKENRNAPGGHRASGTAFLCLLVNFGSSTFARQEPGRMAGCLQGLVQCNIHSPEDFFRVARPHDSEDVTSPLISLLGTSVSGEAAALLASCLRLAKPDKLSEVIHKMISRSEVESYMLGLKLIITMSASREGRSTLWELLSIYERAVEIGNNIVAESNESHEFSILKLVAHALLEHLLSAPTMHQSNLRNDPKRLDVYHQSVSLLLKLAWSEESQTASYACGALAVLASSNILHYNAGQDLLKLIELPAALGVTEQAASALCNIAHWNPSQNERDTLVFMSRCAKTLAIRARNRCEMIVQKYLARTMLYASREYEPNQVHHELGQTSLMTTATALLSPLRQVEFLNGDRGAMEDVIRSLWNIGTKDRVLLRPLKKLGAIKCVQNICKYSMPFVEKSHRQRRYYHRKRNAKNAPHIKSQEERFLLSALGLLFLLLTEETGPEESLKHLTWLFSIAFDLLSAEIEGPSKTLVLSLLHSLLAASCSCSEETATVKTWSQNSTFVNDLLEEVHGKHVVTNTFTRLQALAVLDYMEIPATTKSSKSSKSGTAHKISYAVTMVGMLRSRDLFASGAAAGLLSRWALIPRLKKLLLDLDCGRYIVQVVSRSIKTIEKLKNDLVHDDSARLVAAVDCGALSALVAAVRAARNLAIHHSFQPSIGEHGIKAISHALGPLQDYGLSTIDAQTALYALGRNPVNIGKSYKVQLRMQSERLRFEVEESIRTALSNKAKTSHSARRQIIEAGATKQESSYSRQNTSGRKHTLSPKSGGVWERKRREMSSNHWISRPLSAKHVISISERLSVTPVVPLSTRLCRPNALLLSAFDPDKACFRYHDHWRPNIKSLKYGSLTETKHLPQGESKAETAMMSQVREKIANAVMDASRYTEPLPTNRNQRKKRPKTAPNKRPAKGEKLQTRSRSQTATRHRTGRQRQRSKSGIMQKSLHSVSNTGNELISSPLRDKSASSKRPTTAPLHGTRQNKRKEKKHLIRPATANPVVSGRGGSQTQFSNRKVYSGLQFTVNLKNSARVMFKKQALPAGDTKSESKDIKEHYNGVQCFRFDALPDTSTAEDVDLPTYELPDGRFTHYYVKTDSQPPAEGIPRSLPPVILALSKVFPGVHPSTELEPIEVPLMPDFQYLQHAKRKGLSNKASTSTMMLLASTSSSSESTSLRSSLSLNQNENMNSPVPHVYSYKPESILFDVILKPVNGKKIPPYQPPSPPSLSWSIYESPYNFRVQDPLSSLKGNDALSIEREASNDWDLLTALHEEVLKVQDMTMTSRAKSGLRCAVIRHSQYLFEAYALFRAGCPVMFKNDEQAEHTFRVMCPRVDVGRHLFLAGVVKTSTIIAQDSEAVVVSFEKKVATLEKTVSQVATHSHIDFRWRYFYNDETMSAIDEHEKLLSIFFQFFCDETDEITLDRWISFARILQVDLERYQLALLFKWSCSLGETTLKRPDFYECICRLLVHVPLPSAKDCKNERGSAFIHLENLRKNGTIREWENEHKVQWNFILNVTIASELPRFVDFLDRKLRVARNIQHFLSTRWTRWKKE